MRKCFFIAIIISFSTKNISTIFVILVVNFIIIFLALYIHHRFVKNLSLLCFYLLILLRKVLI